MKKAISGAFAAGSSEEMHLMPELSQSFCEIPKENLTAIFSLVGLPQSYEIGGVEYVLVLTTAIFNFSNLPHLDTFEAVASVFSLRDGFVCLYVYA